VFTGRSPFAGPGAGAARVDETRIDTALRVDPALLDDAKDAKPADDEPKDSTKIDEFRLDDLTAEETRITGDSPFAPKDRKDDAADKDEK
jgi:hypothetical protein